MVIVFDTMSNMTTKYGIIFYYWEYCKIDISRHNTSTMTKEKLVIGFIKEQKKIALNNLRCNFTDVIMNATKIFQLIFFGCTLTFSNSPL